MIKKLTFIFTILSCLILAEGKPESSFVQESQEIILLDLEDFLSDDQERRDQFVQKLGEGLHTVGFVQIRNHGIAQEKIDLAFLSSKEFFELPLNQKQAYQKQRLNRGYNSFDNNRQDKTPDLQEYWHVGPLHPENGAGLPFVEENIWPKQPDSFQADLSSLYEEIFQKGQPILKACSLYMGKEESFLSKITEQGDSIMRVIHYLPSKDKSDTITWKAAHRDPNLITLIVGASKEGLQVQTRSGRWIDVPYEPGAMIVSVSNMLESLSNGLFRSAPHRVMISKSDTSRFAIPFFYHVRRNLSIAPQKESVAKTGGEPLYPNQTAGEALKDHHWFR